MFDLYFDLRPLAPPVSDTPGVGASAATINADSEELFAQYRSALPKLGLKLEPAKGSGEFLVIDRVERPSGN